jgi:hypothetical protein
MSEFCKAFKIDSGDRAITTATIALCGDLSKQDERVKLVGVWLIFFIVYRTYRSK